MANESGPRVAWHTSSYSNPHNECVEVAMPPGEALVRDSKDRAAGLLAFPPDAWAALLSGIRRGEFDLPA